MDFDLNVEMPDRLSDGAWHGHVIFAQWIIQQLKPSVFVELGTHNGDSYFSFCQSVKKNNLPTKCYAVDSWQGEEHAGFYGEEVFDAVNKYNQENYSSFSTLHKCLFDEAVDRFENGSIDLLHIDGFHSYEAVSHDFNTWLPKLSANAIVLFHDTNEIKVGFGVWRFWDELAEKYHKTHFNFLHSHGLGVLGIGSTYSATLNKLFEANGEEVKAYRDFFSTLTEVLIEPVENRRLAIENQRVTIYVDSGNGLSEKEKECVELSEMQGRIKFSLSNYQSIKQIRLDFGSAPVFLHLSNLVAKKVDESLFVPIVSSGNYKKHIQIPSIVKDVALEMLFLFNEEKPQLVMNFLDESYNSISFEYRIFGFHELTSYSLIRDLVQSNSELFSQREEYENVAFGLNKQIDDLQQKLLSKENCLAEINLLNENLSFEITEKIETVKNLDAKLRTKDDSLAESNLLIEELQSKILKTVEQVEGLQQELDLKDVSIQAKDTEIDQLKKQVQQELDSKDEDLKERNNLIGELQLEISYKAQQIEKMKVELDSNNNTINTKDKEIESLKRQLEQELKQSNNTLNLLKHNERNKLVSQHKKHLPGRLAGQLLQFCKHPFVYLRNRRDILEVHHSGLFDAAYYLEQYPDLYLTIVNLLQHYMLYGWKEGRNPNSLFDAKYYLENNQDVKEAGVNPLLHFVRFGEKEGRVVLAQRNETSKGESLEPSDKGIRKIRNNVVSGISGCINDNLDILSIRKSGLFDKEFYLAQYSDVKEAGVDPLHHYFFDGWKEGRNPGPLFDTNYYLDSYEDIKNDNVNPLVHFIKFGQNENRLAKPIRIEEGVMQAKADISSVDMIDENFDHLNVAVVCHLYHIDLCQEFIQYFLNIRIPFDIYISTQKENIEIVESLFLGYFKRERLHIFTFENCGRDIFPFTQLHKEYLQKYDIVCKVHSKKSIHNQNLTNWRTYLLDNLIGNDLIVNRILSEFKNNPDVGLICPVTHPFISHLKADIGWGNNFDFAAKYFPDLKLNKNQKFFFPSGSMFWYRPSAFEDLISAHLDASSFGDELGQVDGTLAHAIERLFGVFTLIKGYSIKKVFFPEEIRRIGNKSFKTLKDSDSILFISHDLFLAGAEMILFHILNWLNSHTSVKINILALKRGMDGGRMYDKFIKIAPVYLWEDLLLDHTEETAAEFLREQIGVVNLIYGNTIQAPEIYNYLKVFEAPIITHVHELEESIKRYISSDTLKNLKELSKTLIACSDPVRDNLEHNHQISEDRLKLVYEFIQPDTSFNDDILSVRRQFNLETNKFIVWGCGTIYWRKGTDIFIQTAKHLKDLGVTNAHFYWIGRNCWKSDSEEFGLWDDWEQYIEKNGLNEMVTFLGEIDNPKRYFRAGDVFYLPSREDPYPLVCLEAAECSLPIICFEDGGGMPHFVGNDAGAIVPFCDSKAAAEQIKVFMENDSIRLHRGKTAKERLFENHSSDVAVPAIFDICKDVMNKKPLVSVIVPVYNQEEFIEKRIESILNQTFRDFEIIVIDDCSIDMSYELAQKYLFYPSLKVLKNEKNSGSVFRQWQKGIEMANGKFIWIAEGDDLADPMFLETLLPAFNDMNVNISYCASHTIDEKGIIGEEHYLNVGHYNGLVYPSKRWLESYACEGVDEIINALSIRNTIPNASGVLMRLDEARKIDFKKCASFRCAGDWFAYVSIIKEGKIYYSPKHLNYHRIHADSVVGQNKLKPENTIPDYFEMHKYLISEFSIPDTTKALMFTSVTKGLRNIWPQLSDDEFDRMYNIKELEKNEL